MSEPGSQVTDLDDFKLWPPAPKTQILLIGIGFFLLNLILIVLLGILFWPR